MDLFFAYVLVKLPGLGPLLSLSVGLFAKSWRWILGAIVLGSLIEAIVSMTLLSGVRPLPFLASIVACAIATLLGWAIRGRRRGR